MMEKKAERVQEHVPYPELYAPEAVTLELTKRILGTDKNADLPTSEQLGAMVSPIDLRRVPSRLNDEEILQAVARHLDVDKRLLEADLKGEEQASQEKLLGNINIALEEGRNYLDNVLGIRVPSAWISNPKDIIELIRKTSRYREENKKGLQQHAAHCALVSVAFAVFELQKKESHTLTQEMRYVEETLTQPSEKNEGAPLFYKHYAVDVPGSINVTISGLKKQCQARVFMRDKSAESQITKYLMKPEASAEAALKDAIGVRVEVHKDRAEEVLERILNYIQENLDASNLKVEDRNFLGKRLEAFKDMKSKQVANAENILVITDTSPLSADSFRAVKIIGMIKVPRGGQNFIDRPIEIQVVEPENKNMSGLSSHAVYELKKHITVMTRLFGGCNESWITGRAEKIQQTEGYPREFIKNTLKGLQDVGFLMRMPKVPNKNVYAATDVYRRWLRVDGLVKDAAVQQKVLHALGASGE